jgi:hypothetical protein
MKTEIVDPAMLTAGTQVTVWYASGSGQGGRFVRIADGNIEIDAPMGAYSWSLATINRVEIDVAHDADECLEYGPDCEGPVDLHTVGTSMRAFPRCQFHIDQRWESYENSMERYADSDLVPEWFDPSYAGESWD